MNIADKRKLYGEIHRVLKPGGRFAFQEMAAGNTATILLSPSLGHRPGRQRSLFPSKRWDHFSTTVASPPNVRRYVSAAHLQAPLQAPPAAPGPLALAVFVDNLAQKAANARRSLEEGQIRLVRGIFRVE